jgi:hypothetical protein
MSKETKELLLNLKKRMMRKMNTEANLINL